MVCQVTGCENEATCKEAVQGIYRGVYIDGVFCHCPRHTRSEINRATSAFKDELVGDCCMVNPFTDARRISGINKVAG